MNWWLGFLDAWNVLEEEFFLFVTYTIIQSITSSEICALHLTHPSVHTPGAVGSRHCGARGAVGGSVPYSRVVDNSCRSRDANPQPRVTSSTLYPLEPRLPRLRLYQIVYTRLLYQIVSHSIVSNKSSKILSTLFLLKKKILCYGQRNIRGQVFVVPLTGSDTVVAVFNSENSD